MQGNPNNVFSVVGHEEHLDSIDEPRIGHSDLGYVYRVRLPHEAIDDFDVGVLREINLATAEPFGEDM
jgi:hypothetical protein